MAVALDGVWLGFLVGDATAALAGTIGTIFGTLEAALNYVGKYGFEVPIIGGAIGTVPFWLSAKRVYGITIQYQSNIRHKKGAILFGPHLNPNYQEAIANSASDLDVWERSYRVR